ncbi:MAG: class I SAM-dependent methyltransferase [bacterium]
MGTGAGAVLLPAAERVGEAGRVIGVDFSEAMVERLRREIARRSLANAQARVMDAQELAFPDGSFDYVLCGFALNGFPDPDRAFMLVADVSRGEFNVAPNHRKRAMSEQLLEGEDVTAAEDEPFGAGMTKRVRR